MVKYNLLTYLLKLREFKEALLYVDWNSVLNFTQLIMNS